MITNLPFFDIPVYRCTLDEHSKEVENIIENKLDMINPSRSDRDQRRKECELRYNDAQWMCWHYNQTVGWLQLYVSGMDILATEYWVSAKRITSTPRNKTIVWNRYDAISVSVLPYMSDNDIYLEVNKEFLALSKTKKYKKRYIDLTGFHNIGPFIRWWDLVNPKE